MTESLKVPTLAEHVKLMQSAEARAQRYGERLAQYGINEGITNRGRTRPALADNNDAVAAPNFIDETEIARLAELVPSSRPLFDQFSVGYYARPLTKQRYEEYTLDRRWAQQTNSTKKESENRSYDEKRAARYRQSQYVADHLQQTAFSHLTIARLRGTSLKTIILQARQPAAYDEYALIHAADAIADFGFCLMYTDLPTNAWIAKLMPRNSTGSDIARLGIYVAQEPGALAGNSALARLVLQQQRIRQRCWNQTFHASVDYLGGDRLTKEDRHVEQCIGNEVARQRGIRGVIDDK